MNYSNTVRFGERISRITCWCRIEQIRVATESKWGSKYLFDSFRRLNIPKTFTVRSIFQSTCIFATLISHFHGATSVFSVFHSLCAMCFVPILMM